MSRYSRLGKNSLLVFIGSIGSKALSILMLPFYTTWLSVSSYGDIDLVSTYVSLIMSIVTLCITDAIFRFPQGKAIKVQQAFFSSGLLIVVLALIIFGVVYYFLLRCYSDVDWGVFGSYSLYIYVLLIAGFLQLYLQQFSRSIDRMSVFVISGIILTFITTITSFGFIPRWGVHGYLLAQLIGLVVASGYTIISIRAYRYWSYKAVSMIVTKEMLSYSVPMIPNATLWWVLGTSNRLFLEHYHTASFVGIFAVANRFPSVITMVFNTFFLSWQISVLEEFKKEKFQQFYNQVVRVCFIFLMLVGFFLCFSSYWLVKLFADHSYLEAWKYIPFLSIAAIFSSLSTLMGTMFMATKTTRYFFSTSFWGGIICLFFNIFLIPYWGIMGATVSLLIAHFVIMCLRTIKSEQFVMLEGKINYLLQIIVLLGGSIGIGLMDIWVWKVILFLFCISSFLFFNRGFINESRVFLLRFLKK